MIRFAKPEDAPRIMKFINEHWKKNHILARDEDFFRYFCFEGENLNFVIAEEDNRLTAILGFIPYSKNKPRAIMLMMWKVIHTSDPILGMKLLDYIRKNVGAKIVASPGTNPRTEQLYRYFGFDFGKMKHWYRLNTNCNYKIAVVNNNEVLPLENLNLNWREFSTFEEMINFMDMQKYKDSAPKPYKDNWYIKKRYFDHPIYKYYCFGIEEGGQVLAVFFYRVQKCNDSQVIRLVDCIGDFNDFAKIGKIIDELLTRHKAEYVDIYNVGIEDYIFYKAGFMKVEETPNIIPNYFSPYEAKNISVYYCSSEPEIVLFNGDGDQDRPS